MWLIFPLPGQAQSTHELIFFLIDACVPDVSAMYWKGCSKSETLTAGPFFFFASESDISFPVEIGGIPLIFCKKEVR